MRILRKYWKKIAVVIFVIFLLLIVYIIGKNLGHSNEPSIINISSGLKDMSMLVTQEYYFTAIEYDMDNYKKLFGAIKLPFTNSEYAFSYSGNIQAGIDFSKIEISEQEEGEKKVVTVNMPSAEIVSKAIDNNSYKGIIEPSNPFHQLTLSDLNELQEKLLEKEMDAAEVSNLYEKATENAKKIITNFINNFEGYKDAEITFSSQS